MNIYECNAINSILSIRTYINTSIILFPTILLFLFSFTLFRTFESVYTTITSSAHVAWTQQAVITMPGPITCTAMSFPIALVMSTKHIFGSCPSFNLKTFERHQLYEIWPYMWSLLLLLCVYNHIHSLPNSSWSKVYLKIDVRMCGSLWPLFLSMKWISSSQCLTSVYDAWLCWGTGTISLPVNTQQFTTMNIECGNSGRLLFAFILACSLRSRTIHLFARLSFCFASWLSDAHFFKNISTHCRGIHSALSSLFNCRKLSKVSKKSAPAISQYRGPFQMYFKLFCPQIMDRCFFSRNSGNYTFFHLLNVL